VSPFQTTVRLLLHRLEEHVRHEGRGAERDTGGGVVGGEPARHVDDLHVCLEQVPEDEVPGGAEVSREPRQVVHQDRAEGAALPLARLREHRLHLGALQVRAALGLVLVDGDDAEPLVLGVLPAAAHLVVDGAGVLTVRRVACVECYWDGGAQVEVGRHQGL
jgi:hypothetical protein